MQVPYMVSIRNKALLFLSLNIIGISIWTIALKVIGESPDILSFLLLGFIVATVVNAMLLIASGNRKLLKKTLDNKKEATILTLAGMGMGVIPAILLAIAAPHISASLSGVVYRSWIIFMVPFIPLILKIRVNKYQVVSLALGFLAIYFTLTQGTLFSINMTDVPYLIIPFVGAISAAFANLVVKSRNVKPEVQNFLGSLGGLLLLLSFLIGATFMGYRISLQFDFGTILAVLFIGLITYAIGSYFYLYAVRTLDLTLIGNLYFLVPFLTFLFAAVLINEPIHPYYIALAFLVISSILIQRLAPNKAPVRIHNMHTAAMPIFDITSAFVDSKNDKVYQCVSGTNRALATTGEIAAEFDKLGNNVKDEFANKYKCILFTTDVPHPGVTKNELEFIDDILNGKEDNVLIGIGDPDKLEAAFSEIGSLRKYENRKIGY